MPMAAWPHSSQALSLAPSGPAPMHADDDGRGAPLSLQGGWDGRAMSPMPPLCFTPPPATLGPIANQLPAW